MRGGTLSGRIFTSLFDYFFPPPEGGGGYFIPPPKNETPTGGGVHYYIIIIWKGGLPDFTAFCMCLGTAEDRLMLPEFVSPEGRLSRDPSAPKGCCRDAPRRSLRRIPCPAAIHSVFSMDLGLRGYLCPRGGIVGPRPQSFPRRTRKGPLGRVGSDGFPSSLRAGIDRGLRLPELSESTNFLHLFIHSFIHSLMHHRIVI